MAQAAAVSTMYLEIENILQDDRLDEFFPTKYRTKLPVQRAKRYKYTMRSYCRTIKSCVVVKDRLLNAEREVERRKAVYLKAKETVLEFDTLGNASPAC